MNPLIPFYRADLPDSQGRWWADIVTRGDDWLVQADDCLPWLFPLCTVDPDHPAAPRVDDSVVEAFRQDPWMRQRLGESFIRMLRLYGLVMHDDRVENAPQQEARRAAWFGRPGPHFARVTRILASLTTLGLPHDAIAFHDRLRSLRDEEPVCGADAAVFDAWREALVPPSRPTERAGAAA